MSFFLVSLLIYLTINLIIGLKHYLQFIRNSKAAKPLAKLGPLALLIFGALPIYLYFYIGALKPIQKAKSALIFWYYLNFTHKYRGFSRKQIKANNKKYGRLSEWKRIKAKYNYSL